MSYAQKHNILIPPPFLAFGPHLVVLRDYSWLCGQESIWFSQGTICQGFKPIWVGFVQGKPSALCTIALATNALFLMIDIFSG